MGKKRKTTEDVGEDKMNKKKAALAAMKLRMQALQDSDQEEGGKEEDDAMTADFSFGGVDDWGEDKVSEEGAEGEEGDEGDEGEEGDEDEEGDEEAMHIKYNWYNVIVICVRGCVTINAVNA